MILGLAVAVFFFVVFRITMWRVHGQYTDQAMKGLPAADSSEQRMLLSGATLVAACPTLGPILIKFGFIATPNVEVLVPEVPKKSTAAAIAPLMPRVATATQRWIASVSGSTCRAILFGSRWMVTAQPALVRRAVHTHFKLYSRRAFTKTVAGFFNGGSDAAGKPQQAIVPRSKPLIAHALAVSSDNDAKALATAIDAAVAAYAGNLKAKKTVVESMTELRTAVAQSIMPILFSAGSAACNDDAIKALVTLAEFASQTREAPERSVWHSYAWLIGEPHSAASTRAIDGVAVTAAEANAATTLLLRVCESSANQFATASSSTSTDADDAAASLSHSAVLFERFVGAIGAEIAFIKTDPTSLRKTAVKQLAQEACTVLPILVDGAACTIATALTGLTSAANGGPKWVTKVRDEIRVTGTSTAVAKSLSVSSAVKIAETETEKDTAKVGRYYDQVPSLAAVAREALRLRPITPTVARVAAHDDALKATEIGVTVQDLVKEAKATPSVMGEPEVPASLQSGVVIMPAGTAVVMSLVSMLRRKDCFMEDPNEFRPDRFARGLSALGAAAWDAASLATAAEAAASMEFATVLVGSVVGAVLQRCDVTGKDLEDVALVKKA